ncbi:PB1 domain-containing protein [Artemisia annua]|uniref:PB1 domain-containing protein n=1 Tax=Artemisia annua TaxID=35608 RepID=A0A2U1PIY0_ARTAN|nr:PB1 domain-containing protein [Artemisia annua]
MSKRVQLILPETPLPSILVKVGRVVNKFKEVNRHGEPTLIQYYECSPPLDPEYNGFSVTLRDKLVVYNEYSVELERYHKICYKLGCRVVGQDTKVENWLAGRAVQTRVADQGTTRVRVDKSDHVLGLFVMPVFLNRVTHKQTVGIIELVTIVPKESYVEDFFQIHKLLKDEGLDSKGMEKTIKVHHKGLIVKFKLSISAKFKDLQKEVMERFKILKHKRYLIEYQDRNGNSLPIISDADLKVCIKESVSQERTVIKIIWEYMIDRENGTLFCNLWYVIRTVYDACNISLLAKWWWRWKTEDLALWKQVIHVIHGPIEGETISKGTWANIKKLDQELQQYNISLKSLFTRTSEKGTRLIFGKMIGLVISILLIEKDCSLNERLVRVGDFQSWNWNWRRDLRSGRETSEFDHLIEVVQDVTLSDLPDSWRWSLEKSGKFTVKSFCSRIEKQIFQSSNHSTRWVKLVPKKVNIMVWRASRDRFFSVGILFATRYGWERFLNIINFVRNLSPRIKASFKPLQVRFFEAVLFTSAWVMWRSRNRKVFTDKSQSSVEVFKEIQQLSYNWISCRCKILSVNWDVWIDNPLEACIDSIS